MASIRRQVAVDVDSTKLWNALRNVGDAHRLFGPVLAESRLQGDTRTATFGNGMVVHERILDVDDERRRVAYAVMDSRGLAYHHASMEVLDSGPGRCEFVWITDFFPPEASSNLAPLIEQGMTALKSNAESGR